MNKKGISPLIGTVLLVAITIAMILVIMPWIMKTVRTQQEKTSEAGRIMACVTDLEFTLSKSTAGAIELDNRGIIDIQSLKYRKVGGTTPGFTDSSVLIKSLEKRPTGITCGIAGDQYEVIAVISVEGKPVTCTDAAVTFTC